MSGFNRAAQKLRDEIHGAMLSGEIAKARHNRMMILLDEVEAQFGRVIASLREARGEGSARD